MNDMYANEYITASFDTLLNQSPDANLKWTPTLVLLNQRRIKK